MAPSRRLNRRTVNRSWAIVKSFTSAILPFLSSPRHGDRIGDEPIRDRGWADPPDRIVSIPEFGSSAWIQSSDRAFKTQALKTQAFKIPRNHIHDCSAAKKRTQVTRAKYTRVTTRLRRANKYMTPSR